MCTFSARSESIKTDGRFRGSEAKKKKKTEKIDKQPRALNFTPFATTKTKSLDMWVKQISK